MSFTVVIPARYASTRLPGKPLQLIGDKPMVQCVYEQAMKSDADKVIVATDDQRIVDAVKAFGGEVCLTADTHRSGTDRIQEVASQYQLGDDHIIVNVQGDEPLIPPSVINQVAGNLYSAQGASAATLSEPITEPEDYTNPNIVKVVSSQQGMALYFSRSPIPFPRDLDIASFVTDSQQQFSQSQSQSQSKPQPQRHIGIYAYRVALLHRFVDWQPAWLEVTESLEQLRILAYGEQIHVEPSCEPVPGGVDTPEDLARTRQQLASL